MTLFKILDNISNSTNQAGFNSRSEKFHKQQAKEKEQREANSPMKNCVLKFDHFENIHRSVFFNPF